MYNEYEVELMLEEAYNEGYNDCYYDVYDESFDDDYYLDDYYSEGVKDYIPKVNKYSLGNGIKGAAGGAAASAPIAAIVSSVGYKRALSKYRKKHGGEEMPEYMKKALINEYLKGAIASVATGATLGAVHTMRPWLL